MPLLNDSVNNVITSLISVIIGLTFAVIIDLSLSLLDKFVYKTFCNVPNWSFILLTIGNTPKVSSNNNVSNDIITPFRVSKFSIISESISSHTSSTKSFIPLNTLYNIDSLTLPLLTNKVKSGETNPLIASL